MIKYNYKTVRDSFICHGWNFVPYSKAIVGTKKIGKHNVNFALIEAPGKKLCLKKISYEFAPTNSNLDIGAKDLRYNRSVPQNRSMIDAIKHAGLWDDVINKNDFQINKTNPKMSDKMYRQWFREELDNLINN